MSTSVRPFELAIPQSDLDELSRRLEAVRWPAPATVPGWEQGVPIEQMRRLCDHWLHRYDWRRCETMLNGLGQSITEIDGVDIHFLHVRSTAKDAMPILMCHGWPGSVIEYSKAIRPLADPGSHGGNPADAFHVVVPSMPGYGFSDTPVDRDWTVPDIASAWVTLMRRLGYDQFVVQGNDWGAGVVAEIAALAPSELRGVLMNVAAAFPDPSDDLTEDESAAMAHFAEHRRMDAAYADLQRTRPETLGYALADSPIGQAAWIYEKFRAWSDCGDDPVSSFSLDDLLDNIMLYWLPNHGATSARLYAQPWPSDWIEPINPAFLQRDFPLGFSIFPKEILRSSRRWAERKYGDISFWSEPSRGGHFPAFEQPGLFVDDVRACFRPHRSSA